MVWKQGGVCYRETVLVFYYIFIFNLSEFRLINIVCNDSYAAMIRPVKTDIRCLDDYNLVIDLVETSPKWIIKWHIIH